jgi:hypothetical protein
MKTTLCAAWLAAFYAFLSSNLPSFSLISLAPERAFAKSDDFLLYL